METPLETKQAAGLSGAYPSSINVTLMVTSTRLLGQRIIFQTNDPDTGTTNNDIAFPFQELFFLI